MASNNDEDPELLRIRKRKMEEMPKETNSNPVSGPINITDGEFQEYTKKQGLVIVDCWAAWCGPCRMMAPILDQLSKEYFGKVVFGKLNVDENPSTASQFSIMSIPTMLVFHNGELVDTLVGASPYQVLKDKIEDYLNKFS